MLHAEILFQVDETMDGFHCCVEGGRQHACDNFKILEGIVDSCMCLILCVHVMEKGLGGIKNVVSTCYMLEVKAKFYDWLIMVDGRFRYEEEVIVFLVAC